MCTSISFCARRRSAQALAKELVALRPDVILAHSAQIAAALQRETRAIPIVFVNVNDPIGAGFVASLARPGGNLTGLLHYEEGISGKWLGLLKEIAPRLARAALWPTPRTPSMTTSYAPQTLRRPRSRSSLCAAPSRMPPTSSANSTPSRACRTVGYSCRRISRPLSTVISSSHSRLATACRRRIRSATLSRRGVSCPTAPTRSTCSGRPPPMSTASCTAPNPPTYRCRRRPSTKRSSTSKRRRRSA